MIVICISLGNAHFSGSIFWGGMIIKFDFERVRLNLFEIIHLQSWALKKQSTERNANSANDFLKEHNHKFRNQKLKIKKHNRKLRNQNF